MITLLRTYLSERLSQELPGKAAHIEVAPSRRIDFDKDELLGARESGVLILFYLIEKEPHLALMQRPTYDGAHSGQGVVTHAACAGSVSPKPAEQLRR